MRWGTHSTYTIFLKVLALLHVLPMQIVLQKVTGSAILIPSLRHRLPAEQAQTAAQAHLTALIRRVIT
jgi:hypothetical protein